MHIAAFKVMTTPSINSSWNHSYQPTWSTLFTVRLCSVSCLVAEGSGRAGFGYTCTNLTIRSSGAKSSSLITRWRCYRRSPGAVISGITRTCGRGQSMQFTVVAYKHNRNLIAGINRRHSLVFFIVLQYQKLTNTAPSNRQHQREKIGRCTLQSRADCSRGQRCANRQRCTLTIYLLQCSLSHQKIEKKTFNLTGIQYYLKILI